MGCSSSQPSAPVCQNEEVLTQDFHDKYLLGCKLGRGAFAQVHLCTKAASGPLRANDGEEGPKKEIAVKILDLRHKERPDEISGQLHKGAHKEAIAWKAVGHHPHCVRLYDLFFGNVFCYMVMEKCAKGLLEALEVLPELTERGLGNMFGQMLLGISHCHSVRVVHRDIKPDNFLVAGEDGQQVKLADFGLSAMIPKAGRLQGVFGTAPFMCPEMLQGQWYDERSDVWSFAVIVYVLLFGLFPYMPKQQSSRAMKQAILDGATPPSFEPIRKGVPANALMRSRNAVSFVERLLHRDPEKRPFAEQALHMPWMSAAMDGRHLPGADLPSLRPMLHSAKKVGAFEIRDPAKDSAADAILNTLQMQRHGVPLPTHPQGDVQNGDRSLTAAIPSATSAKDCQMLKMGAKGKSSGKESWENTSNRSTTCDSSDLGSSSDRGGSASFQAMGLHSGSNGSTCR
jgi:serine/threonine protein kinase